MFKKSIITVLMFFFLKNIVLAQHEFSFYSGGGLSTLNYNTEIGKQKNGLGYNLGFGYCFQPYKSQFGALSGIGLSMFYSDFKLNISDFSVSRYVYDMDEEVDFIFSSYLNGYRENQKKIFLTIPFMVKYIMELNKISNNKHNLYATGGVKIGIPLGGQYLVKIDNIRNTGYYEKEDYEYETQTFRGFGTFNDKIFHGNLDLNIALLFSFEAGMKFTTNRRYLHQTERLTIYTGLFIDYGLNNIYKTNGTYSFVEYDDNSLQNFNMRSVIYSQYTPDKDTPAKPFTDKITPIAVGIKLTVSFERVPPYAIF